MTHLASLVGRAARSAYLSYCGGVLDDNTRAIVAMAWARSLGLNDHAFGVGSTGRESVPDDGRITVLQLLGRTVISGPAWARLAADEYTDDALVSVSGLMDLAKGGLPRATRTQVLLYADDYQRRPGLDDAQVTADPEAVEALLARCAPDEVAPTLTDERSRRFVLLGEDDEPIAGAAYAEQMGIFADLAFVAAIDARASSAGQTIAIIAMHDALDAGLVPQLRVDVDDRRRTAAAALGFEQLGVLATVEVDA